MIEGNIFLWLASFIVGVGSIPFGYFVVFTQDSFKKLLRPANGPKRVVLSRVSVASDLMPLIGALLSSLPKGDIPKDGLPFDGCELRIFGSDGRYIVNSKRRKWRKTMKAWSDAGLKIRYILLEADDEVRQGLADLRNYMKNGRFDAIALNEGALPDIARELESCHPTIFLGRGGHNAAWIEGFHPRDSIHAYDVEYISPRAMKLSRRELETFEYYAAKLDAILKNSHSLVYTGNSATRESCIRRWMGNWFAVPTSRDAPKIVGNTASRPI